MFLCTHIQNLISLLVLFDFILVKNFEKDYPSKNKDYKKNKLPHTDHKKNKNHEKHGSNLSKEKLENIGRKLAKKDNLLDGLRKSLPNSMSNLTKKQKDPNDEKFAMLEKMKDRDNPKNIQNAIDLLTDSLGGGQKKDNNESSDHEEITKEDFDDDLDNDQRDGENEDPDDDSKNNQPNENNNPDNDRMENLDLDDDLPSLKPQQSEGKGSSEGESEQQGGSGPGGSPQGGGAGKAGKKGGSGSGGSPQGGGAGKGGQQGGSGSGGSPKDNEDSPKDPQAQGNEQNNQKAPPLNPESAPSGCPFSNSQNAKPLPEPSQKYKDLEEKAKDRGQDKMNRFPHGDNPLQEPKYCDRQEYDYIPLDKKAPNNSQNVPSELLSYDKPILIGQEKQDPRGGNKNCIPRPDQHKVDPKLGQCNQKPLGIFSFLPLNGC